MPRSSHLVPALILLLFATSAALAQQPPTNNTVNWEQEILAVPSASRTYEYLAYYTSLPHVAGTIEDYKTAVYTQNAFQQFGLQDVRIEEEQVMLSYPISRSLRLLQPSQYTAVMQEEYFPIDPTSGDSRIIPTFNGLSPSGNVTAELVYANFATVEDFAALKNVGVSVKGKVVIARYGKIFRGVKAMIAQQNGAIGLIIYSDPMEDGYVRGPVYPNGPWRPASGVQRGSVQFLSVCPGDPRDPLCAAPANRSTYNYTQSVPAIPVQPISYGDAYPLLRALSGYGTGTSLPDGFQGGLNFTYALGPGPAVVNLDLKMHFQVTTIWNVVARIPADPTSPNRDQIVVIGNHRDAWTFGGIDPNSGTACMLEVARSFGALLKKGWAPQRQLIISSWDAEEYGLMGSTAFANRYGALLQKNAVAYLNVDSTSGSTFVASASPALPRFLRRVAEAITDPNTGLSLARVWNDAVGILGSGSDYTAFLDHWGIPSANFNFNLDASNANYHSAYDSMYWSKTFSDPTFIYHQTLSQFWALATLRLVDASIVPLNYTEYAENLEAYVVKTLDLLVQYGGVKSVNLQALQKAVDAFVVAARTLQKSIEGNPTPAAALALNQKIIGIERKFIDPQGLPLRPYYQHVVQGPGLDLGYGADVYPGLAQMIRDQNWSGANAQVSSISVIIQSAATYVASN